MEGRATGDVAARIDRNLTLEDWAYAVVVGADFGIIARDSMGREFTVANTLEEFWVISLQAAERVDRPFPHFL